MLFMAGWCPDKKYTEGFTSVPQSAVFTVPQKIAAITGNIFLATISISPSSLQLIS
jgi:hypothetical protein